MSYNESITVYGPFNSGESTGGAGVSTANSTSTTIIDGVIVGVYVKYNGSPPAGTTDATIATAGSAGAAPAYNILVLTDAATDGTFYPRVNAHNTSGTAQTTVWEYIPIHDQVKVTIAGANDADSIDVWLLVA